MTQHLYLSLMPEALIASQLEPEEFGTYYAVGSEHKTQGKAAFFEIDPGFRHPELAIDEALQRCVPHPDGVPKRSVYVSVYRVVERVPLGALGRLYLVTQDGRTLGIDRSTRLPEEAPGLHLYHEIAPLHPLVVSTFDPRAFHAFFMGGGSKYLSVPAFCWAELRLGDLATDPERGDVRDLPYDSIDHLRSCLVALTTKSVTTKIVDRLHPSAFSFRTLKNGVFFGNREGLVIYAMPSAETLRDKNFAWWRSANM
ncbi:MAG: hypothetical protein NT080_08585 [Spirochaetes bacterium]|nr:hypothetical protein [Spirochaetota bacterium]